MSDLEIRMLLVYLIVINLVTFLTFGADKRRAQRGKRRVPERTLFMLALCGGSLGAVYGMVGFRHKRRHKRFRVGVPLLLLVHAVLVVWISIR